MTEHDISHLEEISRRQQRGINRSGLRMCMRCKTIKHKCKCDKEKTEVEKLRDEVRELDRRVKWLEAGRRLSQDNPFGR